MSVENAQGTFGADVIAGSEGPNLIHGDSGDDILTGLGGDDTLVGSRGQDTADGGDGTDVCRAETRSNCESAAPPPSPLQRAVAKRLGVSAETLGLDGLVENSRLRSMLRQVLP